MRWRPRGAGLRVVVIERDLRANGASIRNFGFITVTGQARGEIWRQARRARDVWAEVAPQAGIAVEHRGLVLDRCAGPSRSPSPRPSSPPKWARAASCWTRASSSALPRARRRPDALGALFSPHELRVDLRDGHPAPRRLSGREHGVVFCTGETVAERRAPPRIETSRGAVAAEASWSAPATTSPPCFPSASRPIGRGAAA